jgi:SAM-dependent methyltransferase
MIETLVKKTLGVAVRFHNKMFVRSRNRWSCPVYKPDPIFDVRRDLIEFTGLPPKVVDILLERREGLSFTQEWANTPELLRYDHWFYLTSRFYLFANAIHPHAPGCGFLDLPMIQQIAPPGSTVLDYAGGTGNSALTMAYHGYNSHYRELSAIQSDFVRFRAWKHKLKVTVHNWWEPLEPGCYDLACFDSIGHIVQQRQVLMELISTVKPGGSLYLSLEDFKVPSSYKLNDKGRWKKGEREQAMHIANQIGDIHSFLAGQGFKWIGPHWVKARV